VPLLRPRRRGCGDVRGRVEVPVHRPCGPEPSA
jgi:hypothetical protein